MHDSFRSFIISTSSNMNNFFPNPWTGGYQCGQISGSDFSEVQSCQSKDVADSTCQSKYKYR